VSLGTTRGAAEAAAACCSHALTLASGRALCLAAGAGAVRGAVLGRAGAGVGCWKSCRGLRMPLCCSAQAVEPPLAWCPPHPPPPTPLCCSMMASEKAARELTRHAPSFHW
jgi:hypothetical protein